MNHPSILILGNILSGEILDKIRNEETRYQTAADFGLDKKTGVRDEIGLAWAAARAHWTAFRLRVDRLKEDESGASETRNSWMLPLLRELGYNTEKAPTWTHPDTQKSYAISHRAENLGGFPIHIMGWNDSLDQRRDTGGPRLSPHSLVQEYLNHTGHTYAFVSNGKKLRLLRDATRLVRLSYLEFDLQKMMEEELYSDFALLFRLLHATRMPKHAEETEASFIEYYHQESLASGSRIRDKLSEAVEESLVLLGNGFLRHPQNTELTEKIRNGLISPADYYLRLLRLIYRFLFLIVTEERNIVYPEGGDEKQQRFRDLYYRFYSMDRLRQLAMRMAFVDGRSSDIWEGVKATFRIFESGYYAARMGLKPLGTGLFSPDALGDLAVVQLDNETLLKVVRKLIVFENEQKQPVRVNYSDLDVEEFGSVYEGLLEYDAAFHIVDGRHQFGFVQGKGRSSSGSHYTPEELVKPLIKHSLDYLIEDRLKEADPEKALLNLKIADVACGSGHILLSAARRIAFELACIRETLASGGKNKVEQPSPAYVRKALRDVIRNCIYGVDKNPLAVELCKVALWLESHNPGEPLGFLDHHIKCGDAIVGLAHKEELTRGIADEAFKALPGDEKEVARTLAKKNKEERAMRKAAATQTELDLAGTGIDEKMDDVFQAYETWSQMPETSPEEITAKETAYSRLVHGEGMNRIRNLADIQVAQFFIPKTQANKEKLVTDAEYFRYLTGSKPIPQLPLSTLYSLFDKRFFHWFLEFPEVFQRNGFDCILGNPPFLGGKRISGANGDCYLSFIKTNYYPVEGSVDLVGYFLRRIITIININGFCAIIATNTIAQGDTRVAGLENLLTNGYRINFAVRSTPWPGIAAVHVSLLSITHYSKKITYLLANKKVKYISSFLDDQHVLSDPYILYKNNTKSFQGTVVLGTGFIISNDKKTEILNASGLYSNVLKDYINGDDINTNFDQRPTRTIIDFRDWEQDECKTKYPLAFNIVLNFVKPERLQKKDKGYREKWWQFARRAVDLYESIKNNKKVLVISQNTKPTAFTFIPPHYVYDSKLNVFKNESYLHFCIVQSSIHTEWAWKYGTTLGAGTLTYTPTAIYQTFPFTNTQPSNHIQLEHIGKAYHEHRRQLMLGMQLGLTKTYNLFHAGALRVVSVAEASLEDKAFEKLLGKEALSLRKHLAKTPKATLSFNEAVTGILELRRLHVEMDTAVAASYGWEDIALRHDFYEVDYLPENDRVRYTIHPDARREVLKRLLALNHQIFEEEAAQGLHKKEDVEKYYTQKGTPVPAEVAKWFVGGDKKTKKSKIKSVPENQNSLFGETSHGFNE